MAISFLGGPYDGLRLDDHQVAGLTLLVPILTPGGLRVFTLMPSLARWGLLVRGKLKLDESMPHYAYELGRTAAGLVFRDADADGTFDWALNHRCRE